VLFGHRHTPRSFAVEGSRAKRPTKIVLVANWGIVCSAQRCQEEVAYEGNDADASPTKVGETVTLKRLGAGT
jgi:hypothetical protein